MEHAFHQLPFLCRRHSGFHQLEFGHIIFPLRLHGQGGKTRHCCVPIKIQRCLHNHEKTGTQNVNFHFQYTHFPDAFQHLGPDMFLAVPATVFGNQFSIVSQVQRLTIALHRTIILLYGITVLWIFHLYIYYNV